MKKNITLFATFLLLCSISFGQTLVRTYYDFDHKEPHEVYYTNTYGVKNGSYVEYSEYGGILQQGAYKNDIPVGKWIQRDDKGKLLLVANYDDKGIFNGEVVRYMDGYESAEEHYQHGEKNGNWKTWWLDDASVKLVLNEKGKTELHYDMFYKNDLQDSVEKMYYGDGTISGVEHYKNGMKNGKVEYYDDEGNGYIMKEGYFRNDTAIGEWRYTFNGQNQMTWEKSDAVYYQIINLGENGNSQILNRATYYYMTGEKRFEGTVDAEGNRIGLFIFYYPNGQVSLKGKYTMFKQENNWGVTNIVNGQDSIWDMYSINGKDSIKEQYLNGNLSSTWSVFGK